MPLMRCTGVRADTAIATTGTAPAANEQASTACTNAVSGTYLAQLSFLNEREVGAAANLTSDGNTTVVTPTGGVQVDALAEYRVLACAPNAGAVYQLTVPAILSCSTTRFLATSSAFNSTASAAEQSCDEHCSWKAAQLLTATFTQLPDGEYVAQTLMLQVSARAGRGC